LRDGATAQSRNARVPRRGEADPVKALLRRHRELCERAADPLEIAAGLEADGITDRSAVRFRHRDVFSLAEELYARVPRNETHGDRDPRGGIGGDGARADGSHWTGGPVDNTGTGSGMSTGTAARRPAPAARPWPRPRSHPQAATGTRDGRGTGAPPTAVVHAVGRTALLLLPGAVCAAAAVGIDLVAPAAAPVRLAVGAAGAAGTALAVQACLRRGPLAVRHADAGAAPLWTWWLVGHLLFGSALLDELVTGNASGAASPSAAPSAVALAFAVGPAGWCAHWSSVRARRALAVSRGPADFARKTRLLPPAAAGLFLAALAALLCAARFALGGDGGAGGTGAMASAAALGLLLFLARLLAVHGHAAAAAGGLAVACAAEAAALGAVAARAAGLPLCGAVGGPVSSAVTAHGPAAVQFAACVTAAALLLIRATAALSRSSAHPAPTAHSLEEALQEVPR
jgi:hypothetical protein